MRRLPVVLLLSLLLPRGAVAQDTTLVARLYERGIAAAEQGQFPEAVAVMESVTVLAPDVSNAHWNLGLWYAELHQPAKALDAWQAYRRLEPDDWHTRAKLIQTYQALGDSLHRDEERAALIALKRAGSDTALARFPQFCRDQFQVGKHRVMAFETFEPAGEWRVFYTFYVLDEAGEELGRYSLGSYDRTTQVAREVGQVGKDQRLYHLDWYEGRNHVTYGFYGQLPSYDETKAQVVAAMTGARKPVSGTYVK